MHVMRLKMLLEISQSQVRTIANFNPGFLILQVLKVPAILFSIAISTAAIFGPYLAILICSTFSGQILTQ